MAITASQYSKSVADFDGPLAGGIETWVYTETTNITSTQQTIKYVFGFKQTQTYSDNQRFTAWIDGDVEYDETMLNNKSSDEWQFFAVNKTYTRPSYGSSSVDHTARCRVDEIFNGPTSDTGHKSTDTNVQPKDGTVLGAPTSVVNSAKTSSTLTYTWVDPASSGIGPPPSNMWVQLATDPGFTNLVVNGSVGNVNTWQATGLNRATSYYFRVRAQNSVGWGSFSGGVGATTLATVPDTPATPTVSNATTNGFNVNFTAPPNGGSAITSYQIQVSKDNFATVEETFAGVTGSPKVLTGLDPGAKYRARVRAVNAIGAGSYSAASAEIQTLGGVKVWNGTSWIEGIVRCWDGSSWKVVVVRKWNGSSWVV
jgi:hypothetical protein